MDVVRPRISSRRSLAALLLIGAVALLAAQLSFGSDARRSAPSCSSASYRSGGGTVRAELCRPAGAPASTPSTSA
jgi:hypothetical protein